MNRREDADVQGTDSSEERIHRLEAEVLDLRRQLEVADQRLKKRSVERQLARGAAHTAYEIVKRQNDELTERITLFRKFVPVSLSAMLDKRGFDVSRGFSLERTYSVLSTDIRNFTSFTEKIPCQECFAKPLCAGGCYHEAYVRYGDSGAPNIHYCDWIRSWTDIGLSAYSRIMEKNPAFFARFETA